MNTRTPRAEVPEEAVTLAVNAICAGDIEASMAMYEPAASFVGQTGEIASGHDELRKALLPFIALRPTFTMDVEQVIQAGDIAAVVGRWTLEAEDPAGRPMQMSGRNVDVVRRQADGSWLLAIDNPFFAEHFAAQPG